MKNTVGHVVVMAFLLTLVGGTALSKPLQEAVIASKNNPDKAELSVQPFELFNRKDIGGVGGIYEFLNNTTDKAQGICNVDKGRLPSNQAFIFNRISIGYSKALTSIPGGVDYLTKAPAALRNAEFEIMQNGRTVVNLPVASLHNANTGTSMEDQWTELGSLAYLTDNQDFTWSFKFAQGQSVVAGTGGSNVDHPYVEVRLGGYRTIQKN